LDARRTRGPGYGGEARIGGGDRSGARRRRPKVAVTLRRADLAHDAVAMITGAGETASMSRSTSPTRTAWPTASRRRWPGSAARCRDLRDTGEQGNRRHGTAPFSDSTCLTHTQRATTRRSGVRSVRARPTFGLWQHWEIGHPPADPASSSVRWSALTRPPLIRSGRSGRAGSGRASAQPFNRVVVDRRCGEPSRARGVHCRGLKRRRVHDEAPVAVRDRAAVGVVGIIERWRINPVG
jgi:hypothetical protein